MKLVDKVDVLDFNIRSVQPITAVSAAGSHEGHMTNLSVEFYERGETPPPPPSSSPPRCGSSFP